MNARSSILNRLSAAALVAAALSFALGCGQALFGLDDDGPAAVTEMYYTVDDGKTYFADDASKLSPFDKDGKSAVRCYVFTCDDNKTEFVAYLERLTPHAKQKMEAAVEAARKAGPGHADFDIEIAIEGTEVKRPGDDKWVKRNSEAGEKVITVSCPDGKNEKLNIVLPGD